MSDNGMPTGDELELRELERIRDENYSDLLDEMQERWGDASTIGRSEINAFLESRIIHKPATRLRDAASNMKAEIVKRVREKAARHSGNGKTGMVLEMLASDLEAIDFGSEGKQN